MRALRASDFLPTWKKHQSLLRRQGRAASWRALAPPHPRGWGAAAFLSVRAQASHSASHSTTAGAPNGSVTTGPLLPHFAGPTVPCDRRRRWKSTEPSAGHRQGTPGLRTKGSVCITDNPGPLANVSIDGIRFLNQNRIPKILFVHRHRDQERSLWLTCFCCYTHAGSLHLLQLCVNADFIFWIRLKSIEAMPVCPATQSGFLLLCIYNQNKTYMNKTYIQEFF